MGKEAVGLKSLKDVCDGENALLMPLDVGFSNNIYREETKLPTTLLSKYFRVAEEACSNKTTRRLKQDAVLVRSYTGLEIGFNV